MTSISDRWHDNDLQLERSYNVYGVGVFDGDVLLLLDPGGRCMPSWYAARDFVLEDYNISPGWQVVMSDLPEGWSLFQAQARLISEENIIARIIERDPIALKLFARIMEDCSA